MHYKDLSPVGNFGRVAGYGGWPDKILNPPPSQTVIVSGNVAVTSLGVLAGATEYNLWNHTMLGDRGEAMCGSTNYKCT